MRTARIASIALTVAAWVAGCGGSSESARADVDARSDAGDAAMRGQDATDASPGRCDPLPPCLQAIHDCADSRLPCTSQSTSTGFAACFSNGAKWITSVDITSGLTTLRFVKSDGSLCATEAMAPQDGSTGTSVTYKDPSGATIATGTLYSGVSATILCGGQTYNLDFSGCSGAGAITVPQDCQPGVCQ
jgi:hypothetical protein